MLRTRMLTVAFAAVSLLMIGVGDVKAQSVVVSPPPVSYYAPPPAIPRYSLPVQIIESDRLVLR